MSSTSASIACEESHNLQQSEIYFDRGLHRDGSAVFHAGFEAPLLNGFDGFLIEAQAERTDVFEVSRITLLIDDREENYSPLEFRFASFLGIFRLDFEDHGRR